MVGSGAGWFISLTNRANSSCSILTRNKFKLVTQLIDNLHERVVFTFHLPLNEAFVTANYTSTSSRNELFSLLIVTLC